MPRLIDAGLPGPRTLRTSDDLVAAGLAAQIGISQMHVSRLLRAALQALHAEMQRSDHDLDTDTSGSDR